MRHRVRQYPEFIYAAIICFFGIVVFGRCFGSEFVFDSAIIIQNDPRLKGFGIEQIINIFSQDYWWPTMSSDLYRPITTLSYFVESAFLGFGAQVAFYQLTNLALHITLACIGYHLLRRLNFPNWAALAASLWFLAHPYTAEVVPNVVGRADLLAFGSILLALKLQIDWLDSAQPRISAITLWGSVIVIGCLAKESALSGYAICIWYSWSAGRNATKSAINRCKKAKLAITIIIFSGIVAITTVLAPKVFFADRTAPKASIAGDNPLVLLSLAESRGTAAAILGDSLVNTILPLRVSADYSGSELPLLNLPPSQTKDYIIILAALVTIAAGTFAIAQARRRPLHAFFLGAAFLALLPTANIFIQIGTIRADRLAYPAIFFMSALAALGLTWVLNRIKITICVLLTCCTGIALASVSIFTHFRCIDWRTNSQFWESTYASSPKSFKATLGYGNVLIKSDDASTGLRGIGLVEAAIQQVKAAGWSKNTGASVVALQISGGAWLHYSKQIKNKGWHGDLSTSLSKAEDYLQQAMLITDNFIKKDEAIKGINPDNSFIQTEPIVVGFAEVLRARGQFEEALNLLNRYANQNYLSARYQEARGWTLIEAGRKNEGLDTLFDSLILATDDVNRSREIAHFLREGSIPPTQAPLSGDDNFAGLNSWPLLDITNPEVEKNVKAAAYRVDSVLREKNLTREALHLKQSLRSILREDARSAARSDAKLN